MAATASRTIDVRELESSEGHGRILEAFAALAPGGSVVVVGSREPVGLLRRLQAERKGLFEWSPLETGPSSFRVEIARRAAKADSRREISEALAWDHDRLEALQEKAFALFSRDAIEEAQAAWAEFSVGLRRHIRFEEELLFPTFEQKLGMPAAHGPTAVMRAEHREIERLIGLVGSALAGDGDAFALRDELIAVLGAHNMKEEHVIYPGTDRGLDAEERDALVARIQAS
jgi:uncharacterized protein (DUF2249 family)